MKITLYEVIKILAELEDADKHDHQERLSLVYCQHAETPIADSTAIGYDTFHLETSSTIVDLLKTYKYYDMNEDKTMVNYILHQLELDIDIYDILFLMW